MKKGHHAGRCLFIYEGWPAGSGCPCQTLEALWDGRQEEYWTPRWVMPCRRSTSQCRSRSNLWPKSPTETMLNTVNKVYSNAAGKPLLQIHSQQSLRRSSTAVWAGCRWAPSWPEPEWRSARGGPHTSPWRTCWSLKTHSRQCEAGFGFFFCLHLNVFML